MAQTFTDNCFQADHQGQTDLQSFEDNFAALKSMFEGSDQPSNPVAGMPWFDSNKKLPKVRNYSNSAWLGIMAADSAHKIWVYRNTAPDGWAIDSSVADSVIAVKGGGSTNPYNVSGGQMAGTWTQPDHILTKAELPDATIGPDGSHYHALMYVGGEYYEGENTPFAYPGFGNTFGRATGFATASESYYKTSSTTHSHQLGDGDAHNHGTTYRPYAAVGTVQYMDI